MAVREVFDAANTFLAFPVTAIGLAVALWQIGKTRSAAEAAEASAKDAAEILANNHLLTLLPQLQKAEQDLDAAVNTGEQRLVVYHLGNWRWQASQVRGFLDVGAEPSKKLLRNIQQSIALTATCKLDLLEAEPDLAAVTRSAREAISAVTGELGGLMATYSSKRGGITRE